MPFLLLFIVLPVLELWVLIKVGSVIGALPTIALVLLTAIAGVTMLRRQGLATLLRANQKLEQGQIPAREMLDGLFLAAGGALLLTPGFITDILGLICLIPGLRQRVFGRLLQKLLARQGAAFEFRHFRAEPRRGDDHIIEGEFRRDDSRRDRDEDSPRLP
jgi:UPF0716 protein FxsA